MITKRQREILCLLPLTNRQIGAVLGIRLSTVKGHLTNLYRNLLGEARDPVTKKWKQRRCHKGVRTRALTKAIEMGIIEMGDIQL